MQRKKADKKVYSIPDTLQYINNLQDRANRITYLLGYRSSEISKAFRHMIASCNSVAIVFLQFDLLQHALQVLQQAISTDVCMFFEGDFQDRLWHGRVLVYCNLGYLLYRFEDFPSSLKFLYDAESLLVEISEEGRPAHDLTLGHSLITFIVLFKIHKLEQAEKYLEQAIDEFNRISQQAQSTRIKEAGCTTLFCLLTLASEGIKASKTDDFDEAQRICADVLEQVDESDNAAVGLLRRFIEAPTQDTAWELLLSEEFQSLVFITSFFPFITPNTPVINFSELCKAQERARRQSFTKEDLKAMLSEDPGSALDNYTLLMRETVGAIKEAN